MSCYARQRLDHLFIPPTPGDDDSFPQNTLPIHPQAALSSSLPRRTMPQTPPLPNNVQRPRIPDKPCQTKGNGARHLRTGAGRNVRLEFARWGVEKTLIMSGVKSLDKISCTGPTRGRELTKYTNGEDKIDGHLVDPENVIGLPTHPLEDVAGHAPEDNARMFIRPLDPA